MAQTFAQRRVAARATLKRLLLNAGATPSAADTAAVGLEQSVFAAAGQDHRLTPKAPLADVYSERVGAAVALLPAQIGSFPEETAVRALLSQEVSAAELLSAAVAGRAAPDARETGRRLFVRAIVAGAPEAGRARALEIAAALEVSCYNAAVRCSMESAEPPRRAWDSSAFVDIYSTRCGAVYSALDPGSASCRSYGPQLLPQILRGEVVIAVVGEMSERDMCPPATAEERAEIATRTAQRVIEKESTLFACPHCKARRCTYIEVQRRSLDEAPDYFCRCLNLDCGRKFTGRY